jgi:hypothetical protein
MASKSERRCLCVIAMLNSLPGMIQSEEELPHDLRVALTDLSIASWGCLIGWKATITKREHARIGKVVKRLEDEVLNKEINPQTYISFCLAEMDDILKYLRNRKRAMMMILLIDRVNKIQEILVKEQRYFYQCSKAGDKYQKKWEQIVRDV